MVRRKFRVVPGQLEMFGPGELETLRQGAARPAARRNTERQRARRFEPHRDCACQKWRTGRRCRCSGIYTPGCGHRRIPLALGKRFPPCAICKKSAIWTLDIAA